MPYYHHNEKWTPFRLLGIRFFVDEKGRKWIKIWNKHRRPLFKLSTTNTLEGR
jgi:hypothetical protein